MAEFPPDLHYMVAVALINELGDPEKQNLARSTLLTLRSTCKYFAQSARISTILFKNPRFYATIDNVSHLERTAFTFIAPHVENITLIASPYHLGLGLDDYFLIRRPLREPIEVIRDFRGRRGIFSQTDIPIKRVLLKELWKTIIAAMRRRVCSPEPDVKLLLDFCNYRAHAWRDDRLVRSGKLERVWKKVFAKFQNVRGLILLSPIGDHPLLPGDGVHGTRAELLRVDGSLEVLHRSAIEYYDRYFDTVVRCLRDTELDIRSLQVDYELLQFSSGWKDAASIQMSFARLTSLKFISRSYWNSNDEDIRVAGGNVFPKCVLPLQSFELVRRKRWPEITQPPLRSNAKYLRSIRLDGVGVDINTLASDIPSMHMLEELYLYNCLPAWGTTMTSSWHQFFRALRYHKKGKPIMLTCMQLWLLRGPCMIGISFVFKLYSGMDKATLERQISAMDDPMDLEVHPETPQSLVDERLSLAGTIPALMRYISNRGPWTDYLRDEYGS